MTNNSKYIRKEISSLLYENENELKDRFSGSIVNKGLFDNILIQLYKPETKKVTDIENFSSKRLELEKLLDENNNSIPELYSNHVIPEANADFTSAHIDNAKKQITQTKSIAGTVKGMFRDAKEGLGKSVEWHADFWGIKIKTPAEKATSRTKLLEKDISKLRTAVNNFNPKKSTRRQRNNIRDLIKDTKDSSRMVGRLGKKDKYAKGSARDTIKESLFSSRKELRDIQKELENKGLKNEAKQLEKIREAIAEMVKAMFESIQKLFSKITGGYIAMPPRTFRKVNYRDIIKQNIAAINSGAITRPMFAHGKGNRVQPILG